MRHPTADMVSTDCHVQCPARASSVSIAAIVIVVVAIVVGAVAISWLKFADRWEIGTDEGYNVCKSALYLQGMTEGNPVLTDQPPALATVVACVFYFGEADTHCARSVSTLLACSLVTSIALMLLKCSGAASASTFIVSMCGASTFIEYSLAANLTIPSLSVAILAASVFMLRQHRDSPWFLIGSGVLFGLALHFKVSSATLLCSFVVDMVLVGSQAHGPFRRKHWQRKSVVMLWLFAATAAFGILGCIFGWDCYSLLGTHLGTTTRVAFKDQPGYIALGQALLRDYDLVLLAVVGSVFASSRRSPVFVFPLVWLITELLVRVWHRPFWPFHWLHIAVPMAWLGGLGIGELVGLLKRLEWHEVVHPPTRVRG